MNYAAYVGGEEERENDDHYRESEGPIAVSQFAIESVIFKGRMEEKGRTAHPSDYHRGWSTFSESSYQSTPSRMSGGGK